MALDLVKITAALNAYPWTAGTLTKRTPDAAEYCAVGLLLRFAGVPQEDIACASSASGLERYAELLRSEYGITDYSIIRAIIVANDSAATHDEAIRRVQYVLSKPENGAIGQVKVMVESGITAVEPCLEDRDDEGSSCGAVVT